MKSLLFLLLLILNTGFVQAKTEDPTSVAQPVSAYGTYNGVILPLKVASDGTVVTSGGSSGTVSSGTVDQVAKYTGTTTIGSGIITDNGTNVGIGTTLPPVKFAVNNDGLGATQTKGLVLQNMTPSTVGTPVQITPALAILGTAYNSVSGLSEINGFVLDALPATAAGTTSSSFRIGRQIPSGTISNLLTITSGGSLTGGAYTSSGIITAGTSSFFVLSAKSKIGSSSDGLLELYNNGASGFTRANFGGTTSSFPALAVNGSDLQVIRADGSTNSNLLVTGNIGIGSTNPGTALDITGTIRASTGTAGQAACWKADKSLGQCTTIVGAGGGCTCS